MKHSSFRSHSQAVASPSAPTAEELLITRLDVTPLRGRRRGLVRCIFHEDRRASLSVDLDREVFHCFGCGASGGVKRFAELVGEQRDDLRPSRSRRRPDRLAAWRPIFDLSHFSKKCRDLTDRLRGEATRLGPTERAWDLLGEAAAFETAALVADAEADVRIAEMKR